MKEENLGSEKPNQESQLPQTVFSFKVRSWSGGGDTGYSGAKEITNGVLTVKETSLFSQNLWSAKISPAELEELYQVFVENKFDRIEVEKIEGLLLDGPGDYYLSLIINDNTFNVSIPRNYEVSNNWIRNFRSVCDAFENLVEKYQPETNYTHVASGIYMINEPRLPSDHLDQTKPHHLNQTKPNFVLRLLTKLKALFSKDKS